ncbi:MAG: hypothetical protein AMXMBFR46_08620 [Acidimicrobiia bacterium]
MSKAAKRERQRQNRQARLEYEAALEKRRKFWKGVRGFLIILVPIALIFAFLALRNDSDDDASSAKADQADQSGQSAGAPEMTIDKTKTYTAAIETTEGTIEIALDAENAPKSVNNFVSLARQGFYDGLLFNRAAKDFVIQTGSPDNTTAGGPGYTVAAELPQTPYEIGTVAWAKSANEPAGTAGSQFFIGTGPNVTTLPKQYGYIGKVSSGIEVAQTIMGFAPASGDGKPTKDVAMTKVTITES